MPIQERKESDLKFLRGLRRDRLRRARALSFVPSRAFLGSWQASRARLTRLFAVEIRASFEQVRQPYSSTIRSAAAYNAKRRVGPVMATCADCGETFPASRRRQVRCPACQGAMRQSRRR